MRVARSAAMLAAAVAALGLASTASAAPCSGYGYLASDTGIQRFSTMTNTLAHAVTMSAASTSAPAARTRAATSSPAWHPIGVSARSRVELPASVAPPYEVFVNGVPQTEGADYEVMGGVLLFESHPPAIERNGFAHTLELLEQFYAIEGSEVHEYGTFLDKDRRFIVARKR